MIITGSCLNKMNTAHYVLKPVICILTTITTRVIFVVCYADHVIVRSVF